MAGEVNWNDAKLKANLQKAERKCVASMAAHWVRAAKQKVSVSAGGASKKARAVRRTKGQLRGPLRKAYDKELKLQGDSFRAHKLALRAAGVLYDEFRHSNPGEPPRKITGFGQSNIVSRMADTSRPLARAGLFVNALYMYFLETGFVIRRRGSKSKRGGTRVAPRPWMNKTTQEEMPALRRILSQVRLDGGASEINTNRR